MTFYKPRTYADNPPGRPFARQPSLADQRQLTPLNLPLQANKKWIITVNVSLQTAYPGRSSNSWTRARADQVIFEALLIDRPMYPVQVEAVIKGVLSRYQLISTSITLFDVAAGKFMSLGAGGPSVSVLTEDSVYSRVPGGRVGVRGPKIRV